MNTNMNVCTKMDDGSQIRSIRITKDGGAFVELADGRTWYFPRECVPMLREFLEEGVADDRSLKELFPARHPEEEQAARDQVSQTFVVLRPARFTVFI